MNQIQAEMKRIRDLLPTELFEGSKDWREGNTVERIEWLLSMYESSKAVAVEANKVCDNLRQTIADMEAQEPMANASKWFTLVMNAAAELEDASHCLRDEDAKRTATSGAKHYRNAANALYTHPQPKAEQEPVAWVEHHKGGDNLVWDKQIKERLFYTHPQPKVGEANDTN